METTEAIAQQIAAPEPENVDLWSVIRKLQNDVAKLQEEVSRLTAAAKHDQGKNQKPNQGKQSYPNRKLEQQHKPNKCQQNQRQQQMQPVQQFSFPQPMPVVQQPQQPVQQFAYQPAMPVVQQPQPQPVQQYPPSPFQPVMPVVQQPQPQFPPTFQRQTYAQGPQKQEFDNQFIWI